MAEQMDSLSPENIKALGNIIDEAKGLMSQQLEILENILKAEEHIATMRIGHLERYFDSYSTGLDKIAKKQSDLSDDILVANKEALDYLSQMENIELDVKDISVGKKSSDTKVTNGDHETELKKIEIKGVTEKEQAELENIRASASSFLDDLSKLSGLNAEKRAQKMAELFREKSQENSEVLDSYDEARIAKQAERVETLGKQEKNIREKLIELTNLQTASTEDATAAEDYLTSVKLANQEKVLDAEIELQRFLNEFKLQQDYMANGANVVEDNELKMQEENAKFKLSIAKKQADEVEAYRAQLELYYKSKNNGILEKKDALKIQEAANKQLKRESQNAELLLKQQQKNEDNLSKHRGRLAKLELEEKNKAGQAAVNAQLDSLMGKGQSITARKEALYQLTHNADGSFNKDAANYALVQALSNLAQKLENQVDEIAKMKGGIDTRLQGSNNKTSILGSYWDRLVKDMTSVGAVNPFFEQKTFAANIQSLVEKGISFDLKERAFLMTIKDKIATTFEVADGTLLKLIRIQQEDSTAGRLGMESALNAFLNEMYETSEYLAGVAGNVRASLYEMEALMSGAEATEVEWEVQKWLGSLFSVGMSDTATQGIATAFGQIAAGQIEGLTGGGAGNLIIMAANDAGLSIADILTNGISSDDTNELLQAAVKYLAELSDSAKDNQVVQQQLATVFGVKASDLKAAVNLSTGDTMSDIYGKSLTYNNMLGQLYKMAATMGMRTSVGEMMTNVWNNVNYTLAGSMASNPISYLTYKMAGLLESTTGGIDIGLPMVMGNGLPVQFKISDLMRAGAMSAGILGTLPQLISGLAVSGNGALMLARLGISAGAGLTATPRGSVSTAASLNSGGNQTTSGSGYVGNASTSDIKESTIQENEDNVKQQVIEAQEESEANEVNILNTTVLKIYELLDDVTHGNGTFKVKVEGYGLTSGSGGGSTIGGINALSNSTANTLGTTANTGSNSSNATNGGSSLGGNSFGLGGWTM